MKKFYFLTFLIVATICCSSPKQSIGKETPVGKSYKTANTSIPYIYLNGYKNVLIVKKLAHDESDSVYLNELRFNNVYSAFYTQKIIYDKFGRWNKIIPKNYRGSVLRWEKQKLLKNSDELFTVLADGIESSKEMYASVMVFDSKDQDCFNDNSKYKYELIDFFAKEIKKISSDQSFYDEYWKTVNHKLTPNNKNLPKTIKQKY